MSILEANIPAELQSLSPYGPTRSTIAATRLGAEQSKKLIAMLDAIVESIDDWERIVPVLRHLGQRHVAYGGKEQDDNTLCSALVWAFGQALQPGFDNEVRAAWTTVIRDVNE